MECKNCGKAFSQKTAWQKFCSNNCRIESFYLGKAKSALLKEEIKSGG